MPFTRWGRSGLERARDAVDTPQEGRCASLLPIIGIWAVFTKVMFFEDVARNGARGRIESKTPDGYLGTHFECDAVVERVHGTFAESERRMVQLEHGGHFEWIEFQFAQAPHNRHTSEMLVVCVNLLRSQRANEWYGPIEMVCMRCAEAGKLTSSLAEHRRMHAVGVSDAADP